LSISGILNTRNGNVLQLDLLQPEGDLRETAVVLGSLEEAKKEIGSL
jgi:hypothetical protein